MKKTSCLSFIFFLSVALMLSGCTGSGEKPVPPDVYGDSSSSVFTKVLPSAPASVCPSGGIQVNAGFDRNGNNELDDSEVASSQYVCHGTEGLSSLVGVSGEEAGENCVYGGKKVSVGPDANRNGVLDGDEITSSNYLCNASHGDNGRDGRNSLLKIASESPGTNCPTGGVRIISGLDANGNGALDPGEEGAQSYVCNGFEGNGANAGISAPIGVVAAGADGKVVLTWNANPADGITSFNIYWSTDADGTKADAARISGAASPYTVTGLANGTKYYFFVAGVTVLGEGPASWPVSAIPGTPPVAPTDVTATAGTGKNTITWTASTDALYYRLYRSLSTGVTATGSNSAWGSMPDNTTVIDSNVANGTTYYYIVTAVNDYGESAPSAEVSAIPVGPPPAPAGFIATPGDRRIELSWNASPGAASYKIYSDNGNSLIASPTGTSHTVTGLINGHNYCYQIEAANAVGASMMTYACASPNVAPTAPTGVAAVAGDGQVVVSWSTIPGITQYYLYWSPSSGVTKSSANRISVYAWSGGGTYTHTGRSNGTTYYYVVTSANSFEGAESVEVTATPLPGKTAPTTQKAGNVTDASATLSGVFTNPSGYTTLAWLEYGTSTAYGNTAAQAGYAYSGSISLEVLLSDLMEDTAYHYRIVTQNPAGTFYGNDRTFTTLKAPIVVYPEYVSVIASDGTNLYWGGGGMLYSEPISGGTPSTTLATGFGSDRIAVDEANVYTSDSATIRKINKTSGAVTILVSGLKDNPRSLAVDSTHLYWVEYNAVRKVNINGVPVVTDLATGYNGSLALAMDSESIYWSDFGGMKQVSKSGGPIITLTPSAGLTDNLIVDSGTIFWGGSGIRKMALSGGSITTLVDSSGHSFAVDDTHIYFANHVDTVSVISKISINGGPVTTICYAPGGATKLLVDATGIYWSGFSGGLYKMAR